MKFKKNSQFFNLKRDLYKRLSDLEVQSQSSVIRKNMTLLVDKTYHLKDTQSPKAVELMEEIVGYVRELKKEMINPIDQIIANYIEKVDRLLNQVIYESEE